MTSPNMGVSGVSRCAVAGVRIPDFRPALKPRESKPRGLPRDKSIDNLLKKIDNNDARPHEHIPRILWYRRHVLVEPLEQVLAFPYSIIQWMRCCEGPPDADLGRAFERETNHECLLTQAQLAVAHDSRSESAFERYWEASALYRASLDSSDVAVLSLQVRRMVA